MLQEVEIYTEPMNKELGTRPTDQLMPSKRKMSQQFKPNQFKARSSTRGQPQDFDRMPIMDDGDYCDGRTKEQDINSVPEISSFYESEELQYCNQSQSFEQQYEEMIKQQLGGLLLEYVDYKKRCQHNGRPQEEAPVASENGDRDASELPQELRSSRTFQSLMGHSLGEFDLLRRIKRHSGRRVQEAAVKLTSPPAAAKSANSNF